MQIFARLRVIPRAFPLPDILEPGTVLIGYCGERSEQEGSEQVAEFVRQEGWEVEVAPIPALFVHMDGLVVPLDHKLVVTCLEALEGWVIDWLKKKGFDFVDVGLPSTVCDPAEFEGRLQQYGSNSGSWPGIGFSD